MLEFFRDTLSGIWYIIYIFFNLLFIFAIVGYIGEKKSKLFSAKQRENELEQFKHYETMANNQTNPNTINNVTDIQNNVNQSIQELNNVPVVEPLASAINSTVDNSAKINN